MAHGTGDKDKDQSRQEHSGNSLGISAAGGKKRA